MDLAVQDLADRAVGEEQHVQRSWGGASGTGLRKGKGGELGKLQCSVHREGLRPTPERASWKDVVQPRGLWKTRSLINIPLTHALLDTRIVLP